MAFEDISAKFESVMETGCLCTTSVHEVDELKCKFAKLIDNPNVNSQDASDQYLVLIGSLETFCDRWLPCFGNDGNPVTECSGLVSLLMEIVTSAKGFAKVLALQSQDPLVRYANAKLMARILLLGGDFCSEDFVDLYRCLVVGKGPCWTRLSVLTIWEKMLQHSDGSSSHPSVLANPPSGDGTKCSNRVSSGSPITCQEVQVGILKTLECWWREILKAALPSSVVDIDTDGGARDCGETAVICAVLRVWDAGIACHGKFQRRFKEVKSSTWCVGVLVDVWMGVMKELRPFDHWSTVAVSQLLGIVNKCLDFCSRNPELVPDNRIPRIILQSYADGDFDAVSRFAAGRGFGGTADLSDCGCVNSNFRVLALVILKAVSFVTKYSGLPLPGDLEVVSKCLDRFEVLVEPFGSSWLWILFSEKDDHLVDALLCSLDIRLSSFSTKWNDPHEIFFSVLNGLSFDHQVILDWITSSETMTFLEYLIRYLKLLVVHVEELKLNEKKLGLGNKSLVDYCVSSDDDDDDDESNGGVCGFSLPDCHVDAIVLLCRSLKISVEKLQKKQLFPYNAQPLLKLLGRL